MSEANTFDAAAVVQQAAAAKKRVKSDAGEFENYELSDLVKAAEFLQKQSGQKCMSFVRMVPTGSAE